MRFQVSRVMDAIEQRLTTDLTGAQAVVDLAEIVNNVDLDRGRPVNLVRIGMVLDALSRYLVDGGAMLYGVVERNLLAEPALTSKERMVLGRWADDGRIEVTPTVGDRVVEIADLTGLPLIALHPYAELADRYGWLRDSTGRVLMLTHRGGTASLRPMDGAATTASTVDAAPAEPAIGRARVPQPEQAEDAAPGEAEAASTAGQAEGADGEAEVAPVAAGAEGAADLATADAAGAGGKDGAVATAEAAGPAEDSGSGERAAAAPDDSAEAEAGVGGESDQPAAPAGERTDADEPGEGDSAGDPDKPAGPEQKDGEPLPLAFFAERGARVSRTQISRHRFRRGEPSSRHAAVLRREWRCDAFDCPAFGEHRQIGQPVPRIRGEVPVCPRHDQPVADAGPRRPAYAVSVVVDDLPRRRLVVRSGRPVEVGRATDEAAANQFAAGPSDPDLVSVTEWLHQAAAAWISPVHLRLEACDDGLVVTDLSENGTVVWQRKGPDDPGTTRLLQRETFTLGEWDGVELYTGIELVRADRRLTAVLGRDEPTSVLQDAPTAAHQQVASR